MNSVESWSEWSPAPRESEAHNELLTRLANLRNLANGDIAERMAADGDEELIKALERTRIDDLGNVSRVAMPDDPDYSPDKPPRILSESELEILVDRLGASIARGEHGTPVSPDN